MSFVEEIESKKQNILAALDTQTAKAALRETDRYKYLVEWRARFEQKISDIMNAFTDKPFEALVFVRFVGAMRESIPMCDMQGVPSQGWGNPLSYMGNFLGPMAEILRSDYETNKESIRVGDLSKLIDRYGQYWRDSHQKKMELSLNGISEFYAGDEFLKSHRPPQYDGPAMYHVMEMTNLYVTKSGLSDFYYEGAALYKTVLQETLTVLRYQLTIDNLTKDIENSIVANQKAEMEKTLELSRAQTQASKNQVDSIQPAAVPVAVTQAVEEKKKNPLLIPALVVGAVLLVGGLDG